MSLSHAVGGCVACVLCLALDSRGSCLKYPTQEPIHRCLVLLLELQNCLLVLSSNPNRSGSALYQSSPCTAVQGTDGDSGGLLGRQNFDYKKPVLVGFFCGKL